MECKKLRKKLIANTVDIVSGKTLTLITNNQEVYNGEHFILKIELTGQDLENWKTSLQGNEIVQIQLGTGTTPIIIVCEDRCGNALMSAQIWNFKCKKYCLCFGNNGAIDLTTGGLQHFIFENVGTLYPSRNFDGANTGPIIP